MSEPSKGILFNAEMVRALLNTKVGVWPAEAIDPRLPFKCQTRRICKRQWTPGPDNLGYLMGDDVLQFAPNTGHASEAADYKTDHVLHVRETFLYRAQKTAVIYRADLDPCEAAGIGAMYGGWKPSIFLPRKFSRIWLKVAEVRVHRVNEISEDDAIAEGIVRWEADRLQRGDRGARTDYAALWDSINGKGSFAKGPWVFAYTFARVK